MYRSDEEILNLQKNTAECLVSCYSGQNLAKIGTHLAEKSSYNYNFYQLPNGATVLLESDDEGFNKVSVECPTDNLICVGAQYSDGPFMLGNFS